MLIVASVRSVLEFFSEFFEAACFGQGVKKGVTGLPGANEEQVSMLIGWAYSGRLRSNLKAEEIWIFTDKIPMVGAPSQLMMPCNLFSINIVVCLWT